MTAHDAHASKQGAAHGSSSSKTIDDILNSIHSDPTHDIAKNLSAYDKHMASENQQMLFNDLFAPAIDDFYTAMKEQLDHAFAGAGKDTAKVKGKMPEVRKALVESLKKFFAKAMPSALDALEGIADSEKQYEVLAHFYDTQVLGINTQGDLQDAIRRGLSPLGHYLNVIEKDDKLTIGQLKEHLYLQKAQHVLQARGELNEKAKNHYIVRIPAHQLAKHLKSEVEKKYTIDDAVGYVTMDHDRLMQLRNGIKTGVWSGDQRVGPENYGLKEKQETAPAGHGHAPAAHGAAPANQGGGAHHP